VIFIWGRGDFIMFLLMGQPNGPLQKKLKTSKQLGCTTTS
jgi:hypothetical protein